MTITEYEPHPIAECLPQLDETEFTKLVESVKSQGVLVPIVLFEGKILDGRHRYLASIEAGCVCPINYYTGDDPYGHVIALNDLRRHLTVSQRAMVGTKMATLKDGQKKQGASNEAAQPQVAKALGISRASIQAARVVEERGTKAEKTAVVQGKESVRKAASEIRQREKDAAPVETGSLALIDLHRKFRSLFGNAATTALAEGNLANLKTEKDLTFFLSLPEAKIRAIEELVIGQRWCPRRAVKAVDQVLDANDRIGTLMNRCIAAKGKFSVKINTFTITITKD